MVKQKEKIEKVEDETTEAKAPKGENVRVYKTTHPKTIIIGGKSGIVKQGDGSVVRERITNAIVLNFRFNLFFLTEAFAKMHGLTFDQMVEVVENHSQFRSGEFWRLDDPDEVTQARARFFGATAKRGLGVTSGVKTSGDLR